MMPKMAEPASSSQVVVPAVPGKPGNRNRQDVTLFDDCVMGVRRRLMQKRRIRATSIIPMYQSRFGSIASGWPAP